MNCCTTSRAIVRNNHVNPLGVGVKGVSFNARAPGTTAPGTEAYRGA